jgi:hypothetical protein
LPIGLPNARAVADQTAGGGEFAPRVDRRQRVARGKRQIWTRRIVKESVTGGHEGLGVLMGERREGCIDFALSAGLHDLEPKPKLAGRSRHGRNIL